MSGDLEVRGGLVAFLSDVALDAEDKAEWYERLAKQMVKRAEVLEAVAAAAVEFIEADGPAWESASIAASDRADAADEALRLALVSLANLGPADGAGQP